MEHAAFRIGLEFWCSSRHWRCTDIGTRTVIAIRIDSVELVSSKNGVVTRQTLSGADAEAQGWFDGPPYGVAEMVFDEDDFEGCSLEPEGA